MVSIVLCCFVGSCRPFQRLARMHYTYELDVERVFSWQMLISSVQLCT